MGEGKEEVTTLRVVYTRKAAIYDRLALTSSHAAVLGGGKKVPLGDDDGGDAQDTDDDQVDETGLWVAVKGVVEPGNEAAHDEERDAGIVQPSEEKERVRGGTWSV